MSLNNGRLCFPYILFDLGSTLIYFDGDMPAVMVAAIAKATAYLRSLGYALDERSFPQAYYDLIQEYYQRRDEEYIEYTTDYVLREVLRNYSYPTPPAEHIRQALKVMYSVTQAYWHVEGDAAQTLSVLRASGHHLGLLSNAADDADVHTLVDKANLREYFDFILTSAKVGVRKPNPRIFQAALEQWEAQPGQVVMVGDTVAADVVGAKQMGMASIWITRRGDTPENHQAARKTAPDATIYALDELPALLENWPVADAR